MLDWIDQFRKAVRAWRAGKRWPFFTIGGAVLIAGGILYFGTLKPAILTSRQFELATTESLFLDCKPDIRVTVTKAQNGDLPTRVIFLSKDTAHDLNIGPLAQNDQDLNIYEIHNTFKRCKLENNGAVEVHHIQIQFTFHGYGPNQNLVSSYPFTVDISDLERPVEFAITSAAFEKFYVFPPTEIRGRSTLNESDHPIPFDESEYTAKSMSRDMLAPTILRKSAWKPSPCMFLGSFSITTHRPVPPGGLIGTVTLHIPKACAGAPWITGPANP